MTVYEIRKVGKGKCIVGMNKNMLVVRRWAGKRPSLEYLET